MEKEDNNMGTTNEFKISPSGVDRQEVNQNNDNRWENPGLGYNLQGQCARSYNHHYNTADYEVEDKELFDGI